MNRMANGAQADVFTVDPNSDGITLENYKTELKKSPKLVCVFACVQRVRKCFARRKDGKTCKRAGALFLLDASQSAGVLPVNIEKDGYDFVCCRDTRAFTAPRGRGFCS
jgi:selenocysteine lyase/cysteine desulfurase